MSMSQKETVDELRIQWKRLWLERAEDKVRAEGIATTDYCDLFLEKGTIIHATRDFKSPNFCTKPGHNPIIFSAESLIIK